jgi:hypothetical protein
MFRAAVCSFYTIIGSDLCRLEVQLFATVDLTMKGLYLHALKTVSVNRICHNLGLFGH